MVFDLAAKIVADQAASRNAARPVEDSWETWLRHYFARYLVDPTGAPVPFASHHAELWSWIWSIQMREAPKPQAFVAIWPRGSAKSTSAELACAALAARGRRRYVLYIGATQERADDHVANIAHMLESSRMGSDYPDVGAPALNKFGNVRGWRRNRLRTASGYTIDALGLDTAARGAKMDEARPDFQIYDDIDMEGDSREVIARKVKTISTALLPAGAPTLGCLVVQNLIHRDSIVSQILDGRADFLRSRFISGPHPAIRELEVAARPDAYGAVEQVIVSGEPTWAGQGIAECQRLIDTIGLRAFLVECQHDLEISEGGLYDGVEFRHCYWEEVPWRRILRTVVWVDPAVTDSKHADAHGIQVDALSEDGIIYRLYSWEGRTNPEDVLMHAILKALEYRAQHVGVETDQGGDTWRSTFQLAWTKLTSTEADAAALESTVQARRQELRALLATQKIDLVCPRFRSAKAGAGYGSKVHRGQQMLADYVRGRIVHVYGTHRVLEEALRRFPLRKPYDLADAAYWSFHDLRSGNSLTGSEQIVSLVEPSIWLSFGKSEVDDWEDAGEDFAYREAETFTNVGF